MPYCKPRSKPHSLQACTAAHLRAVASTIQSVKGQSPRTSMMAMSSARASAGVFKHGGAGGLGVGTSSKGQHMR